MHSQFNNLTCNPVSPARLIHIARAARRQDSLLVPQEAGGVTTGSQHTAVRFLAPANEHHQCKSVNILQSCFTMREYSTFST